MFQSTELPETEQNVAIRGCILQTKLGPSGSSASHHNSLPAGKASSGPGTGTASGAADGRFCDGHDDGRFDAAGRFISNNAGRS